MKKLDFINKIGKTVIQFDSSLFYSIMIAQACLESGYGTSELAVNANNLTGHKSDENDQNPYIKDAWEDDGSGKLYKVPGTPWKRYGSMEEWAEAHSKWLERKPDTYRKAINARTVEEQASALQGTYATDTGYANKLLEIIEYYDLRVWDKFEKGNDNVIIKPKIIDRRKQALGYPGHGIYARRRLTDIKKIVWHYTATTHQGYGADIIKRHEAYWKGHHGWDIGGYHFYIDRQGNIFWNYDLEICTYGAGKGNPYCMHISLEAKDANDYTDAQIKAREQLTLWLMSDNGPLKHLGGSDMRGHKEIPTNYTACPGYSISQLDQFRQDLTRKLASPNWVDTKPEAIDTKVAGNKYIVKHGDTLWAIAKAFGVGIDQLRQWNGIKEGQWLKTGQTVYVKAPTYNAYTVMIGDSLWKIAEKFKVTVADLKAWNGLKSDVIHVGQSLFVAKPLDMPNPPQKPVEQGKPIKKVEEVKVADSKAKAIELKDNQRLVIDAKGKILIVTE